MWLNSILSNGLQTLGSWSTSAPLGTFWYIKLHLCFGVRGAVKFFHHLVTKKLTHFKIHTSV